MLCLYTYIIIYTFGLWGRRSNALSLSFLSGLHVYRDATTDSHHPTTDTTNSGLFFRFLMVNYIVICGFGRFWDFDLV
jgi:hypothetical protein